MYISISLRNILEIDELRQVLQMTYHNQEHSFSLQISVDYLGNNNETLLARPQVERDASSAGVEQLRRLHLVTSRHNTVYLVP